MPWLWPSSRPACSTGCATSPTWPRSAPWCGWARWASSSRCSCRESLRGLDLQIALARRTLAERLEAQQVVALLVVERGRERRAGCELDRDLGRLLGLERRARAHLERIGARAHGDERGEVALGRED